MSYRVKLLCLSSDFYDQAVGLQHCNPNGTQVFECFIHIRSGLKPDGVGLDAASQQMRAQLVGRVEEPNPSNTIETRAIRFRGP
jgi:hypothetical protein